MGILCPVSRKKKETTMPQPAQDVDILCEDLWQDLPPETVQTACEFKAFTRARQVKTPVPWLRLVLLNCGLDKTLREVAGHFSVLEERLTDRSVALRLVACRPWVLAVLARMVPPLTALPVPRRFLVMDASGIQAPGARGTPYRLHLCRALVHVQATSCVRCSAWSQPKYAQTRVIISVVVRRPAGSTMARFPGTQCGAIGCSQGLLIGKRQVKRRTPPCRLTC
jgi:hypothetical protein